MFEPENCSVCGKSFVRMAGSIYKVTFAGKTYHQCGYDCNQIALRVKDENNQSEYKRYLQNKDK